MGAPATPDPSPPRDTAELQHDLQQHRRALTALTAIQRAITARSPLEEVLEAVVAATSELLGGEQLGLMVRDDGDPSQLHLVAAHGSLDESMRIPVGEGAAGRCVDEGRLVVVEEYEGVPDGAFAPAAALGVTAVMAAPVHENGSVVGALVVAHTTAGYRFSHVEQQVLVALAEHASLAHNDARTIAEMTRQALHDPLTGLPNRTLFSDRLEHARERARRTGATIAVLFCDLDRFKTVNDSLGHAVGDELLTQVARRLDGCLRAGDTAARLGGDEFAILLEDVAGPHDAQFVADRILSALRRPVVVAGRELFGHASIGIALAVGGEDIDLLRRADVAMYRAKSLGRGRSALFEPAMQLEAVERVMLEADLDRALDRGELEVHYQPIIDLRTGVLTGFEALSRWRHPSRGLLAADHFVPLAEETGRLTSIGRHVLREATRTLSQLRRAYPDADIDTVTINLSAGELADPTLRDDVTDALATNGLPAECLVIEITESALIGDTSQTLRALKQIKGLGIRLAVDDFGTGYSALRYLSVLPLDLLKMAKPFVDDVERGGREAALCSAIVDLASNLGLYLVAEGIEVPTQASLLRSLGCSHGQGFHFDQALSRAELDRAVEEAGRDRRTWRRGPVELEDRGLVRIG